MTVINPNSISGVASVTAQGDIIQFYKSDGTLGAVQFDGANFNTTSGVSTFNNLYVGGVLTYEDVKNVDAIGIVTAREGIFLPDSKTIKLGNTSASPDLEIYHDSNHNNIKCVNGNLRIWSNSSSEAISCVAGAQVTLSHGNTVRLSTTNTGVTVTGDVLATSLYTSDSIIHRGESGDNTKIRFPADDTVTVETNGSERIRITSAGKVLVGDGSAITPVKEFDVRGTGFQSILVGSTNNQGAQLVIDGIGGGDASGGNYSAFAVGTGGNLEIKNYDADKGIILGTGSAIGANDTVVIKDTQDVGIGTDSPSYRLQVHDSDGNLLRVLTGHESTYDLRYVYQNSEANIWSYGSTDLTFGTRYNKKLHLVTNGPGKRLTIDGSGLVGIGDQSPTVSLSLKRNQSSNHYVRVENINSSSTYVGLSLKTPTLDCQIWNQGPNGSGYGGANSMNFYQAGTNGPFAFFHGTTERFRIDTSGRLLYGKVSSTRETSLVIVGNSNSYTTNPGTIQLEMGNTPSNLGSLGQITFGSQDKLGAIISGRADQDWNINSAHGTHIRFMTTANSSAANPSEKMRLSSDGFFLVNCQDTGYSSGYTDMTIGNASAASTGLTIASSSSNGYSRLHFADGTSGTARYAGWIAYDHADDRMKFGTGNSGSTIFCLNADGAIQFGTGSVSGGNYSSSGAINLIDFGSGTLNRGMGWGGTNANYTNIWTEYSTGALHLGIGIRPTGTSTGWVSSYGGGSIGRSALKMDLNGDISIFTGSGSQINAGSATNLTQKWFLNRNGDITHQFAGRHGHLIGSTDGSGAYFTLDGEAGGTLGSGTDYMYMEHTSSGMFEMWNGKTGVQTSKFMDVHPQGYMRLPKKPIWDGDGFNAGATAVQTSIIPLRATRVNVNQGGHFDNSTGVFTCPVAGYYQIHGHVNRRASYAQWIGIYVILNGATKSSTWWPPITADATAASGTAFTASHFTYMPLGIQHTFYCSANDELSLCYHQSYSAPGNANDVTWHIELIA